MPNNSINSQESVIYLQSGVDDPRARAYDAVGGTLYLLLKENGYNLLQKQDDGPTTNWREIGVNSYDRPDTKVKIVLCPHHIQQQCVTLSEIVASGTLQVSLDRLNLYEDTDYTVSLVNGMTVISFIGSIASGGLEEVEAGQTLFVRYKPL